MQDGSFHFWISVWMAGKLCDPSLTRAILSTFDMSIYSLQSATKVSCLHHDRNGADFSQGKSLFNTVSQYQCSGQQQLWNPADAVRDFIATVYAASTYNAF